MSTRPIDGLRLELLRRFEQFITDAVNGRRLANYARRPPVPIHQLLAVVALGEITVMDPADQSDVLEAVVATKCEGLDMVEFEPFPFSASAAAAVYESALMPITLANGAPNCGRYVPR